MDTNQNTANNYQINTFVKGMNSDTSYDMIGTDQYLFGQNIRITNNTLIFGDQHQNKTEGAVTPVYISVEKSLVSLGGNSVRKILATACIDNIGIVIIASDNSWYVLRILKNDDNTLSDPVLWYAYTSSKDLPESFSVVLHKETEAVINLYIADGEHPVIQLQINNDEDVEVGPDVEKNTNIDSLISSRLLPTDRLILEKTSGRLKTQQVQYTYRFYRKYGATTKLAPPTNKFNVIDPNRNKEQGNAEDTRTSVGFKLTLTTSDETWEYYDHLQVYRVSYIKQHEQPHIYLIYDDVYTKQGITEVVDKGEEELQELSLDEYYALNSQIIIPQSIESNQGYLFAGNIQDETTFFIEQDLGNTFKYVTTTVPIDNINEEDTPGTNIIEGGYNHQEKTIGQYFKDCGVKVMQRDVDNYVAYDEDVSYNSIIGSSLLRSLRRDEIYKYGVVYYDDHGARSNVIEIVADSETTGTSNITSIDPDTGQLDATPIGIQCHINTNISGHNIVGYQIVRCEKTDNYTKNILQVALSRPSRQSKWENDGGGQKEVPEYRTPYYPNVYLSTQFLYITYLTRSQIENLSTPDLWRTYFDYAGTNVENVSLYQAFSPEINILRKDTVSQLSLDAVSLNPIRFAYYNESLGNIAAMFETITGDLDSGSNIYVYFQPSNQEEDYRKIQDATPESIGNIENPIEIGYQQDTNYPIQMNYRIQVFVPSGFEIESAYYKRTLDQHVFNTTYTDITTFVYNFGRNPDNLRYHYYRIDGIIESGEELCIKLKTRTQATGSHIVDILPNNVGSLYSSLDTHNKSQHVLNGSNGPTLLSIRSRQQQQKEDKSGHNVILKLYNIDNAGFNTNDKTVIENIADAKNPDWSQGFSSIQLGDDSVRVVSAIKQYKSFTTNVGGERFVNWVANGMYDLAATQRESAMQLGNKGEAFVFHIEKEGWDDIEKGWTGPGPVSLLLNTKTPANNSYLRKQISDNNGNSRFGTIVANISHTPLSYSEKYSQYYGFGNFRLASEEYPVVFDGDIYITPAEFTNMFKTYDFNDQKATLMSGQDVYYIPMESRINTFFDYGMNYRNTSSTNLMLEPGEITGIASQSRPLHQYNMIYSDNNTSVDVFSQQVPEDKESLNHIPQRICYSQLKTDGENIDNWQIFKPVDFIDVDSQYGEITNLLTSDNTLYYWQDKAFGKLSVNERSLVKDENSNAIQLGTGGVLNRYDYLSTRYGMRKDDRAAIAAEHGIYWIDINNKAIPAFTGNGVVNYSELCNVQNLVNQKMADDIPTIYYDLQNYEVLCGINEEEQIVFNIKLNCATALYTRDYDRCLDMDNSLYGFRFDDELYYRKINYLTTEDDKELLSPVKLSFAVNHQASLTKVYDTQKIVLMDAPGQQEGADISVLNNFGVPSELVPRWMVDKVIKDSKIYNPFLADKEFSFSTDYCSSVEDPQGYTDRENNIWYAIPRITNSEYGDRIRGKWLKTEIIDNNPKEFAISHIITKFRQSYS